MYTLDANELEIRIPTGQIFNNFFYEEKRGIHVASPLHESAVAKVCLQLQDGIGPAWLMWKASDSTSHEELEVTDL